MQYFVKKCHKRKYKVITRICLQSMRGRSNASMGNGEALNFKGDRDAEVLKGDCTSAKMCVKR